MKVLAAVLLAPVLLALVGLAPGAPERPKRELVKAELLADVSAVKPGEPFTVGVRLKVEPGWHVYWHNPGDSGLATTMKLALPTGFEAGPVQYPVPVKFSQPGNAVGYGYEREVMLTARVTPPADMKDKQVTLTADVSWLACEDACVPGKAKLLLKLPVAERAAPANREIFGEWSALMPVDGDPAIASASWEVDRTRGTFTHTVKWKTTTPKKVELYPGKSDVIEFQQIDSKPGRGQTRTTVKARLWPGQTPEAATLPSLLVYTDEQGKRHGIPVEIPVGSLEPTPLDQ